MRHQGTRRRARLLVFFLFQWVMGDPTAWALPRFGAQTNQPCEACHVGAYGMRASIWPGGDRSAQRTDLFTNLVVDANWQWIADPNPVVSDMISAHATSIRDTAAPGASRVLLGSRATSRLDVMRAGVSYSIGATWTPTVQVFHTRGVRDAAFGTTPSGRPDSTGAIFELAWVPRGKPDSWTGRFNVRVAAQYVASSEFNGSTRTASANNALYLSAWSALRF